MSRAGNLTACALILAAVFIASGCSTTQTAASVRALKPSEAEELLALQAARQKPAEGEPVMDPTRIEAHADGLALQGEWSSALYQYGRALGLAAEADKPRLRAKLGESSLKAGMFVPAEGLFAELAAANPRDAQAWQGLGLARFGQGKLDQAAQDLAKAAALEASLWRAHNALGIIHNRQGQPDAAVVSFRAAIRQRPELPALYNNLGLAYMLKKDWTQAEASLRQALRIKPDYALAANNLGLVLARQGRSTDAFRAFETAEGQAKAHHNLGVVMAWQGDLPRAADHFRQAVNVMPRYYPLADRHLEQIEEMLGRNPGVESLADKISHQPAPARQWPVVERPEPRDQPRSPAPLIPPPAPRWPTPPPGADLAPLPMTDTPPALLAPGAAVEPPRLAPGPKPPAAAARAAAEYRDLAPAGGGHKSQDRPRPAAKAVASSPQQPAVRVVAAIQMDEQPAARRVSYDHQPASQAYRDASRQTRESLPIGFVGFIAEQDKAHLVKGVIVGQDGGFDRLEGHLGGGR